MSNHDLELKLRFKRILMLQNYWSPLEVNLSLPREKNQRGRTLLTDLDVLGVRYDTLFCTHTVVGDCKTGDISESNRLFWLRGVSDFFRADTAYLIHRKLDPFPRLIAPSLRLRTLDEKELEQMEKNLKVERLAIPLTDRAFYDKYAKLSVLGIPKGTTPTKEQKIRKDVLIYLNYKYWALPHHTRLFATVKCFSEAATELAPGSETDILLAHQGLERFTHCLLECAREVFENGLSNLQAVLRNHLYGGSSTHKDRKELAELFEQLNLKGVKLYPDYIEELEELVNRIIINPEGAADVLPNLEQIYFWCVFMGNSDVAILFKSMGREFKTSSIVVARDIAKHFVKFTGLRSELFQAVLQL